MYDTSQYGDVWGWMEHNFINYAHWISHLGLVHSCKRKPSPLVYILSALMFNIENCMTTCFTGVTYKQYNSIRGGGIIRSGIREFGSEKIRDQLGNADNTLPPFLLYNQLLCVQGSVGAQGVLASDLGRHIVRVGHRGYQLGLKPFFKYSITKKVSIFFLLLSQCIDALADSFQIWNSEQVQWGLEVHTRYNGGLLHLKWILTQSPNMLIMDVLPLDTSFVIMQKKSQD